MCKVGIIEPVGGHGGMNHYDLGLLEPLVEKSENVYLFTSIETDVPNKLSNNVYRSFKGIWGEKHRLYRAFMMLLSFFRTFYLTKKLNLDILHFHFFSYGYYEYIVVLISKVLGYKVVITVHDIECFASGKSGFLKKIAKMASLLICHNYSSKKALSEICDLESIRVAVIPHGNYINYFSEISVEKFSRSSLGLEDKDFVLLFFGQIKEVKGLDILLRALKRALLTEENVKLIIAGKVWKDNFIKYESLIKELGIDKEIIKHIKYIPDEQVKNYFDCSDVIVLPYKNIYQSGVVLLSMSLETPVIVSNLPGMLDVVSDKLDGLVFKANDHASLSEAIIYAKRNPVHMAELTENARLKMKSKYSWEKIASDTLIQYKGLV